MIHATDRSRTKCILIPLRADAGEEFPKDFVKKISPIYKRLFRIYAHMYHSHMDQIQALDERAAFDISCKHFILFAEEFALIDQNSLAPLADLVASYGA